MRSLNEHYDTVTFVTVPPRRFDYNAGRMAQQYDEHARKKIRLTLGLGASILTIAGVLLDFQALPILWGMLLFHCALHVIL